MSFTTIVLESPLTAEGFLSVVDLEPGQLPALQSFENYLGALSGGNESASLDFKAGAVQAKATLTSTGAAVALQTATVCNVLLTAVAAAPLVNQFVVSATPSIQAANIAAAINGSPALQGLVTAEALLGVVTITAVVPGIQGNGFQLSSSNLTNVTAAPFSGGSDGSSYFLDFL